MPCTDGARLCRPFSTDVRRERARLLEGADGSGHGGLDVRGGGARKARELGPVERGAHDEDSRVRHDAFPSFSSSGFQTRGAVHARAEKRAESARPRSADGRRASNASTTRATSAGADAGTARRASDTRPAGASVRTFSQGSDSAASSGGVEMYHIAGVTPEAPSIEAAFGGRKPLEVIPYGRAERRRTYDNLNSKASDPQVDYVMLGCPHYSLEQIKGACGSAPTAICGFSRRAP